MAVCTRLMVDYALDGLKIDFLNNVMSYAGTPSTGDIADVGDAMTLVLREISEADRRRPARCASLSSASRTFLRRWLRSPTYPGQ